MIQYIPKHRMFPPKIADVPTAWREVTPVVESILDDFNVKRGNMLEFGVDHGYSTAIFANFFKRVIGIDHFMGDGHAGMRPEGMLEKVRRNLSGFPNITLIPMSYKEFIRTFSINADLIHVDIVHTYDETFECGEWSVKHSPIVMFHDTLAFPEVMRAVKDLAAKQDLIFYNIPEQHGMGILVRKEAR